MKLCLSAAAAFVLLTVNLAVAQGPRIRPMIPERQAEPIAWAQAEQVFVARLEEARPGPVGKSMPPFYTHTLRLTIEKPLRGPAKQGDAMTAHHSARQMDPPVFPVGKSCIVAVSHSRDMFRIERIEEAAPALVAEVELACSLPLGWTAVEGKPVSPWASLGDKAWPADAKDPAAKVVCSKSGRPAYMAGAIAFEVEKVPPAREIQWTNPDGDGEYKITVTNPTEQALVVPALLSVDGKILWEESLVILCQQKAYACPGSRGVSGKVAATTLAPGQSVSTVVNALRLRGPEWPRGGYRIEFQFCLGEKSRTQSFYYMSRHHDALRDAAQKRD